MRWCDYGRFPSGFLVLEGEGGCLFRQLLFHRGFRGALEEYAQDLGYGKYQLLHFLATGEILKGKGELSV